jgi:outer membrane immunogenic protein
MRKLTLALVAGTALISAPALAADLRMPVKAPPPVIAPFNWSGFYIGIQGGGGFGTLDRELIGPAGTLATFSHDTSGGLLGGTVGFNWQSGSWVFGIEADYGWADIGRGSVGCLAAITGNPNLVCASSLDTFGTARLRLGWAWDRFMLYGTGGLAFGDQSVRVFDTVTGAGIGASRGVAGWTAGGGFEWAFAHNWSAKVEALYFDLEPDRFSTTGLLFPALAGGAVGIDSNHTGVVIRGGINYRFNWGGPVVASY